MLCAAPVSYGIRRNESPRFNVQSYEKTLPTNDPYEQSGLDAHQSSISIVAHNYRGRLIAQSIIETKSDAVRAILTSSYCKPPQL